MDAYERAAGGGKLKLKGEKKQKKHKKKHKKEGEEEKEKPAEIIAGSGRIVTSGCSVQGFETKFKEEVEVGDEIIIKIVGYIEGENRIVTGILSPRCLTVHAAFSTDFTSTTCYKIKKVAKLVRELAEKGIDKEKAKKRKRAEEGHEPEQEEENEEKKEKLMQDEVSRRLQKKLKNTKSVAIIREKTGMWGYKTIRKDLNENCTAEDLLNMRVKQGRDKFCW